MNIPRILRTIIHLRPVQVFYQVKSRIFKSYFKQEISSEASLGYQLTAPVEKGFSFDGCTFSFLSLKSHFNNWNFTSNGMLWAYNLNYMDWLGQEGMTYDEGAKWIDRFIDDIPNNKVGLDPYPIALRGINWIKFISKHHDRVEPDRLKRWNDSLFSQYRLLEKKLEWHLLGNHLLEDAYSLFIASIYFNDAKMYRKYSRLLRNQLKEQVLPDGAHYEQSPMYHCILLDRLLDCYNISVNNILFPKQTELNAYLREMSVKMLGHLDSIIYQNGDIPLLNDSAFGIAPSPSDLFSYAERLGIRWGTIPLKECGYRRFNYGKYEAVIDVGNITASYQPGHTHADSLNYELRIDGRPYIVDTGISTYNKTERRQFERSTIAHNCVSPDGKDSSEVWGGFRVGRRCHVEVLEDSGNSIIAWHDGFGRPCKRRFHISEDCVTVEDWYGGDAVSYIHLAEGADINRITIEGAKEVCLKDYQYSTEYNVFHNGKVIEIHFNGHLKYTIR